MTAINNKWPNCEWFVTSIPRSGTNFTRYHLLEGEKVLSMHFWAGYLQECLDLTKSRPTIIPLRHPLKVAGSWKNYNVGYYATHPLVIERWPLRNLPGLWGQLREDFAPLNPQFLPIDSPRREEHLEILNKNLGTEFKTDWPMISERNVTICPRVELTDDERNSVCDMMDKDRGFFGQWYE